MPRPSPKRDVIEALLRRRYPVALTRGCLSEVAREVGCDMVLPGKVALQLGLPRVPLGYAEPLFPSFDEPPKADQRGADVRERAVTVLRQRYPYGIPRGRCLRARPRARMRGYDDHEGGVREPNSDCARRPRDAG